MFEYPLLHFGYFYRSQRWSTRRTGRKVLSTPHLDAPKPAVLCLSDGEGMKEGWLWGRHAIGQPLSGWYGWWEFDAFIHRYNQFGM